MNSLRQEARKSSRKLVARLDLVSYAFQQNRTVAPSIGSNLMQPLWCNIAAMLVVLIFMVWRTHWQVHQRRNRILRERVALMLWAMAEVDSEAKSLSVN
jgi:hypothetical protein